jgi:hypothetical protein
MRKGLPYFSLSQFVKGKVKKAVSYIDDYEMELAKMAKAKGCDGIICGHIHKPENRMIDGIHYLNSGDWVETMSALAEDFEGNWELIYFTEIDFKKVTDSTPSNLRIEPDHLEEHILPHVAFTSINDAQLNSSSIQL